MRSQIPRNAKAAGSSSRQLLSGDPLPPQAALHAAGLKAAASPSRLPAALVSSRPQWRTRRRHRTLSPHLSLQDSALLSMLAMVGHLIGSIDGSANRNIIPCADLIYITIQRWVRRSPIGLSDTWSDEQLCWFFFWVRPLVVGCGSRPCLTTLFCILSLFALPRMHPRLGACVKQTFVVPVVSTELLTPTGPSLSSSSQHGRVVLRTK